MVDKEELGANLLCKDCPIAVLNKLSNPKELLMILALLVPCL